MSGKGTRTMGLDVGERRIGVAIADELGAIASPLTTIARGNGDLDRLHALARERDVSRVIVGMPTGMSGREGPQAAAVRAFAMELEVRLEPEIVVDFWDERLTTTVAERMLKERGVKQRQRREQVDAMAAAVILQGYLDAARARAMRASQDRG